MRINIDIEDRLMQQAMRSSRLRTKRAAVEAGLRLLIQSREQTCIRWLRGKVRSDEKLNTSRWRPSAVQWTERFGFEPTDSD